MFKNNRKDYIWNFSSNQEGVVLRVVLSVSACAKPSICGRAVNFPVFSLFVKTSI